MGDGNGLTGDEKINAMLWGDEFDYVKKSEKIS
jgi:hypothetical protein